MQALTEPLLVAGLLWLRCAPLFFVAPYLAVGIVPGLWSVWLSSALAGSLTPLILASCDPGSVCAAALSGGASWAVASRELVAGLVIALGLGLPCAVLRSTGAIAQALGGSSDAAAGSGSQLGRAASLTALVAIALAGGFSGVAQLLLQVSPPLSAADAPVWTLLRPLAELLIQAFEVGVRLCGPLLLAAACGAIVAGLFARVAGMQLTSVGPALVPWLGIALVSLCVANWLDSLPEIVRAFADRTARLLTGLP
jgi:flagellar biosynthesis protein FliR